MLTPEAQAQIAAAAERRAETWAGRRPLTDPRNWRTGNDARQAGPGWEAWSCARADADENHLGGVIVASDGRIDADTGEITEGWIVRNAFVRPDDYRSRRRISAAEVLIPHGLIEPQVADVTRLIRRLARYLFEHDQPWLTATDLDAIADLWALTGAVA